MLTFLHAKATTEEWPDLRDWNKISEQKCLARCWKLSHTLLLCFVRGPHNNRFVALMQIVSLKMHRKGKHPLVGADMGSSGLCLGRQCSQVTRALYWEPGEVVALGGGVASGRTLVSPFSL